MSWLDRRGILIGAIGGATTATAFTHPATAASVPKEFEQIRLWPDGIPGESVEPLPDETVLRRPGGSSEDIAYTRVGDPRLIALRPQRPNGTALLLLPGGGYQRVAIGHEGYAISRRFAAMGYTCFNLLYRLPGSEWRAGNQAPLHDAQCALRLIRDRASSYGCSPERVGIVGFSAGGHLAGWLATSISAAALSRDPVDAEPLQATFAALLYPVVTMEGASAHKGSRERLLGTSPSAAQMQALSIQNRVRPGMPPTFLAHGLDDRSVPPENSLLLLAALREQGIATECHLFENGGHGFGLTNPGTAPAAWPDLLAAFARRHGA